MRVPADGQARRRESRPVAVTTRTLTRVTARSPTRVIFLLSITRSSFVCPASTISPTLFRNRVPLSACSKQSGLVAEPVNAPSTHPNSSLSTSDSGSAAALTVASDPSCRWEHSRIRCANSSVPVPLSSVTSTGASKLAYMATVDGLSSMAAESRTRMPQESVLVRAIGDGGHYGCQQRVEPVRTDQVVGGAAAYRLHNGRYVIRCGQHHSWRSRQLHLRMTQEVQLANVRRVDVQ